MSRHASKSDRFWHDKHGRFVMWQRPNALLLTWFACIILLIILPGGTISKYLSFLAELSIFIWAFLELFWGASYFRRLIGLCVILLIITTRII